MMLVLSLPWAQYFTTGWPVAAAVCLLLELKLISRIVSAIQLTNHLNHDKTERTSGTLLMARRV